MNLQEAQRIVNTYNPDVPNYIHHFVSSFFESLPSLLQKTLPNEELVALNQRVIAYTELENRARELISSYEIALSMLERDRKDDK